MAFGQFLTACMHDESTRTVDNDVILLCGVNWGNMKHKQKPYPANSLADNLLENCKSANKQHTQHKEMYVRLIYQLSHEMVQDSLCKRNYNKVDIIVVLHL